MADHSTHADAPRTAYGAIDRPRLTSGPRGLTLCPRVGGMVRTRRILQTVAWGLLGLAVPGAEARAGMPDWIEWTTRIDVEAAIDTGTGAAHQLPVTIQPEIELDLPLGTALTSILRLRGDGYDRLEPGAPTEHEVAGWSRRWFIGNQMEIELRELYLDAEIGRTLLRLGKQQVVWGEADGLKVLDVVNPQHFREFILPEFEDSRIPLWTVNAEIPVGDATLQLLWIPDPTHHEIPEPDARFAITSERIVAPAPPGLPVVERQVDRPSHWLHDSDAGARLSGHTRGWDWSVNYLFKTGDFPVLSRRLPRLPGEPVVAEPDYRRTHVAGVTAGNAFGDLTVRAELGVATDRWFAVDDPTDRNGVEVSPEVLYVLGLDWYGFEESLVSLQVFQSWITDHADGMLRKRLDTNLTLLLRRELFNDRLTLETIVLQSWNDRDGLVRPRVGFEWRDDVTLSAGFDFFYGDEEGIYGQYDRNDRFWLRLRWTL